MTTETEPLVFNPLDPDFPKDPYSVYARLRSESPVLQTEFGAVVFSRYADIIEILRDPRSSSDGRNSNEFKEAIKQGLIKEDEALLEEPSFLFRDPPDHTRLRGLVNKAFTPRTVEKLRPRIQSIVDGLVDEFMKKDSFEVIEDIAYPLPVAVICEMLGVPVEDHVQFREWSRNAARSLDPVEALPPDVVAEREETFANFEVYFTNLVAERRVEPQDDLISALIAAEDQGNKLSENELIGTCSLLLVAGHETTVNLIGNGMLALLRHPEQLAKLQADSALAQSAVEEVLRYDPPVQFTGRIAKEDMEIGGAMMKKGQQSILLIASANRDAAQFPDPDTFDITREDNQNIAFSYGIHFCVGAPLARVEGQIALETMARRVKDMKLLVDEPEYKENIVLRGLAALPVGFSEVLSA